MADTPTVDCAVIGAGPSGLIAALYLRRFHRPIAVFDTGESRARWIPESHNCPGFPEGVSGNEFLAKLREQAGQYGVVIRNERVTELSRRDTSFEIATGAGPQLRARSVILATGVTDVLPDAPWTKQAIETGALRLCAICDGYEASDGKLVAYGPVATALGHAIFLRTFSRSVTVAATDPALTEEDMRAATEAGVELLAGPCELSFDGQGCSIADADGETHHFDTVYPALGVRPGAQLATALGAKADGNGELIVDKDQMTSIEGLYAIGDVVRALNQISVGVGHAAIAATAAHNLVRRNYR